MFLLERGVELMEEPTEKREHKTKLKGMKWGEALKVFKEAQIIKRRIEEGRATEAERAEYKEHYEPFLESYRETVKPLTEALTEAAETIGNAGNILTSGINALINQAKKIYQSGKYYTITETETEYILIIDGKEKKRYTRIVSLDTQERFEEMQRIEAEINKLRPIKTRPQLLASFYALFVDNDKKAEYLNVLQNKPINQLNKYLPKKPTAENIDVITGGLEYKEDDFLFKLQSYTKKFPKGISVSCSMLLDFINQKADKQGRVYGITLSEYMEFRNLSDRTSARQQLNNDLKALQNATFSTPLPNRNQTLNINLFSGNVTENENDDLTLKDGKAIIILNIDYYTLLTNYYGKNKKQFFSLPAEAFTININNNPNSYFYIRYISLFKHMNLNSDNHRNGNRISVKSIVESNPNFMNYKEKKGHKNFSGWILEPFERDMSIFKSFSWHYDQEEPPRNFEEFYNAYVIITWNNYPIEEKKKLTEQRQKHKKKQSKNN